MALPIKTVPSRWESSGDRNVFDGAGEVNEEEVNVVKTPEGELVLCGLEKLIVCASITCAMAEKRIDRYIRAHACGKSSKSR